MVEFSGPVFLLLHSCASVASLGGKTGEMFVFTYCIMGKWNKPAIAENKISWVFMWETISRIMGIHFFFS